MGFGPRCPGRSCLSGSWEAVAFHEHFRLGLTAKRSPAWAPSPPPPLPPKQTKKPKLAVPRPRRLGRCEAREGEAGCCGQEWAPQPSPRVWDLPAQEEGRSGLASMRVSKMTKKCKPHRSPGRGAENRAGVNVFALRHL